MIVFCELKHKKYKHVHVHINMGRNLNVDLRLLFEGESPNPLMLCSVASCVVFLEHKFLEQVSPVHPLTPGAVPEKRLQLTL